MNSSNSHRRDSKELAKGSVGQFGSLASSIGIQAPAAGIAIVPSVMAATVGRSGPYPPAAFPFDILPWIALGWLLIGVGIIVTNRRLRATLAGSPMFRARYAPVGASSAADTVPVAALMPQADPGTPVS